MTTGHLNRVLAGTIWAHYKGGRYRVVGSCIREEDGAACVLYQSVDGGPWFSRPISEWLGTVPWGSTHIHRFVEEEGE